MRISLFADIHANREALQACLDHAAVQGVTHYAFLGDLVGYGADPEWVLETIAYYHEQGALVVIGNHDEAVLWERDDAAMRKEVRASLAWTSARLTSAHRQFLAGLAPVIEDMGLILAHANPWQPTNWEYITDTGSAAKSFTATTSHCVMVGHFHCSALYHQSATKKVKPFLPPAGVAIPLSTQRRWLAVIGSVGQPRDGNPAACYAIYDTLQGTITYHRVPFDTATTAAKIRAAGLPEWNATRLMMGI